MRVDPTQQTPYPIFVRRKPSRIALTRVQKVLRRPLLTVGSAAAPFHWQTRRLLWFNGV